VKPPAHPAKFSNTILRKIDDILEAYEITDILDPFGGVGGVFNFGPAFIVCNEIEHEWALQAKENTFWFHHSVVQSNALHLPFRDGAFKACVTSPTYANRMADKHDAKEKCSSCAGTGIDHLPLGAEKPCVKCGGKGHREYKRLTYKHQLGRDLHPSNSGGMQWGDAYRDFHHNAWTEVSRVCREFFILNVSDHIRARKVIPVSEWHVQKIESLGWLLVERNEVETPRMKFGQNNDLRISHENIFVFRRP